MRLCSGLVCLAFLTACHKSHRGGPGVPEVLGLASFQADDGREVVYASDAEQGRIVALSTRTGALSSQILVGEAIEGLAVEACGKFLYVAVPRSLAIDEFLLPDGVLLRRLRLHGAPYQLATFGHDHLLAVTTQGLSKVRRSDGQETPLVVSLRHDALLQADERAGVIFTAEAFGDVVRVSRIPDDGSPPRVVNLPLRGALAGFRLGQGRDRLFVAAQDTAQVLALRADNLSLEETHEFLGETLRAFTLNPLGTRLYVSPDGSEIECRSLRNLAVTPDRIFPLATIEPAALGMGSDALSLVTREAGDFLQRYPAFSAYLQGRSAVSLGETLDLRLEGEAGEGFVILVSLAPGFVLLQSQSQPDPQFLDIDPARLFVLRSGVLDASGVHNQQIFVRPLPTLPGLQAYLQAVLLDRSSGRVRAVSNPLPVRVRETLCP